MTVAPLRIDRRVGSVELVPHVTVPVTVTTLPYGDFALMGNGPEGPVPIGIERKTITDLVSSIHSGRLSGHQLVGLMAHYEHVYVVVEGLWRPRASDGLLEHWHYGRWAPLEVGRQRAMARVIVNYLNTLAVMCGVHVWRTGTIAETGVWLGNLYRWWQKDWAKHQAHKQWQSAGVAPAKLGCVVPLLHKPGIVARVANSVPGVGNTRATEIGKVYDTVLDLAMASVKELQAVPGVGKVTAESIVRSMRGGRK